MKKDWNETIDNMKKKMQADYKKCLLGKIPLYNNFLDYFEKTCNANYYNKSKRI